MLRPHLLVLMVVVLVKADSPGNPPDFSALCSSPAPGGNCPAGWTNVQGDCFMFAGWDEVRARETCSQVGAEFSELCNTANTNIVPVFCVVRRQTQCGCGQANREVRIVNGVNAEKNEYPWQGKVHCYTYIHIRNVLIYLILFMALRSLQKIP